MVVSNERCVAKGLINEAELRFLHQRMREKLAEDGGVIDEIYYCPHELQPTCACRKPAPGMLLTAAKDHRLDLASSWMVGDSDLDMEAGRKAGCKTALVLGREAGADHGADLVAGSLLDAAQRILQRCAEFADRPSGSAPLAGSPASEPGS